MLDQCASRAEGDANRDGKVDASDLAIWQQESTSGEPDPNNPCQCIPTAAAAQGGGGQSAAMASSLQSSGTIDPDIDGDGDVDTDDIELWIKELSE